MIPTTKSTVKQIGVRRSFPSFDEEIENSPMTSRGWIHQERLLARRALHFGASQMSWECKADVFSETLPIVGAVTRDHGHQFMRQIDRIEVREQSAYEQWNHIIAEYSKKRLTKTSDRYAAILGIANRFGPLCRSKFIAGLWLEGLHVGRTWLELRF